MRNEDETEPRTTSLEALELALESITSIEIDWLHGVDKGVLVDVKGRCGSPKDKEWWVFEW